MPISLYDAFVPTCRQILAQTIALTGKAEAFCAEKGIAPKALLTTTLAEDMFPLAFQLRQTAHHSGGAIEGVRAGVFGPARHPVEPDFAVYRDALEQADRLLATLTEEEMEGWVGRDMRFEAGERRMDFTVENFLLSFSQPNFFFHATTSYAILRGQSVPLGKRDYIGQPRIKG